MKVRMLVILLIWAVLSPQPVMGEVAKPARVLVVQGTCNSAILRYENFLPDPNLPGAVLLEGYPLEVQVLLARDGAGYLKAEFRTPPYPGWYVKDAWVAIQGGMGVVSPGNVPYPLDCSYQYLPVVIRQD